MLTDCVCFNPKDCFIVFDGWAPLNFLWLFRSRKNNLFGSSVLGLGWGTVEFGNFLLNLIRVLAGKSSWRWNLTGGPRSDFLRRVNLEVVDNNFCNEKQLCTYTDGKDLCTYDSGGPVLLINNSFVFNVGIVSYGIACATKTPSANTRVANYLDWIMTNTKSTVYCVKWCGLIKA